MHTHATPAGYKHLPIIMLAHRSRPRVKGPLNSNGGEGEGGWFVFIAKGATANVYDARVN